MENKDTKICPLCGEEVKVKAIKCRYCHSNLQEPNSNNVEEFEVEEDESNTYGPQYSKRNFSSILPILIQTAFGIFILLIIWLVAVNLPMLEEISLPLDFNLSDMISAAILTFIVIILINFAIRIELRIRYLFKTPPQVGDIVKNIIYVVSLLIIYFAYNPILTPYLGDLDWLYHLVFLAALIILLTFIGISVYSNVDQVTTIITESKKEKPVSGKIQKCIECGMKTSEGKKFCPNCGASFPKDLLCQQCGAALKKNARFCSSCGTKPIDIEE